MNNMIVRALSGAVYVGLIVGSLLLGAPYFTLLMAIFALLGVNELQRLLSGIVPMGLFGRVLDYLMVICTFAAFSYLELGIAVFFMFALLYLPLRIIAAVASRDENPARAFMYSLFSLFYVGFPLVTLTFVSYGWSKLILLTFIIIWLNDTGAYLTGCTMGRTKLCERLSPKKTWEGFWGGFILSAIAGGVGLYLLLNLHSWMTVTAGVVYGMLVSVIGTYGDLFESLIKRTLGVKDSGNLIPGHGGILDRIDSLLAVAPLTLLFISILPYIF